MALGNRQAVMRHTVRRDKRGEHAIVTAAHSSWKSSRGEIQVAEWVALGQLLKVRVFHAIIAAALAFAWLPLASHCSISTLPGFEFFRCSVEETHASHDSGGAGDPCRDGGCCAVESAKYQSTRQQPLDPIAPATVPPTEQSVVLLRPLPAEVCLGVLTAAPPELPVGWQFSLRTALPVRAPSSAS